MNKGTSSNEEGVERARARAQHGDLAVASENTAKVASGNSLKRLTASLDTNSLHKFCTEIICSHKPKNCLWFLLMHSTSRA